MERIGDNTQIEDYGLVLRGNVLHYKTKLNLTYAQMQDILDGYHLPVSITAIQAIANGKTQSISFDTLNAICFLFQKTPQELFSRKKTIDYAVDVQK